MGNLDLDRLWNRVLDHQSDPSHLEMTWNDRRSPRPGAVSGIPGRREALELKPAN
jgi:hypothetical protein